MPSSTPAVRATRAAVDTRTAFARLPLVLRILWLNYAFVVAVNLTVWMLVNVGDEEIGYFWPMWLAVPGVVLVGASAALTAVRSRPASSRHGSGRAGS